MLAKTPSTTLAGIAPTLGAIDRAKSAMTALSDWMRGRETIVDDDAARRAHEFVDRANKALATLEDERDSLVRPFNTQVRDINDRYRTVRAALEKVRDALKSRLTDFARREEAERVRKAEEIRKAAEEAAQAALEAEQRLTEALIDEDVHGVVDTDFGILEERAAEAIDATAKACRELARAERDTKVRIGGGYSRVMTLRDKEVLTVDNWHSAIMELGTLPDGTFTLPEPIRDAVLTCARAHKKATGDFPAGITQTFERRL